MARLAWLLLVGAGVTSALLGSTAPSVPATEAEIMFQLEDREEPNDPDESDWKSYARRAVSLEQLDCSPELLGATYAMVDAAEEGDSLAMAALGTMYILGQQCAPKRNLTWGMHWLTRAEELSQPDAQALMGFLHASDALRDLYNYTGLVANRTHARLLYDRAARGGSAFGSMAMAFRHGFGIGVRESCAESAAFYEQAARASVEGLNQRRSQTVEQSNPVENDHLTLLAKAMPQREKMDASTVEYMDYCANIGDVSGKVGMGHLYHSGTHGVPCDREAAMHWFRSAARQGDGMGHANLGMMQLKQRQFKSALRSLRRASKQNDPSAWAGLGYAHLYGAGVPQSDERAARCMWLAAKQGHLDSIYNLGVLTLQGKGVEQNVRSGFRFLSVAAEFSHPQAQLEVGRMVRRGLGVHKDCATAQFFLKHAAEAGPLTRSLMGTALHAFEKDRPQRAMMHYLLAAHAGIEAAQHNAAHLYMHVMPKLRPEEALVYKQRAVQYFKLAVLQGSADAKVQLANLLVEAKDYQTAAGLLKEAGRAGSKDALFHLGTLYWHGDGVEANAKTAFALWQSSDFSSKHATLKGLQGFTFGVARFIVQFRAFLLFAAGLVAIVSTGGNPAEILRGALGGAGGTSAEQDWHEEDEDLFGEFGEEPDPAQDDL